MKKYTPGPWVSGPEIDAVLSGEVIIPQVIQSASRQFGMQPHIANIGGLNQSNEEIEANGRLIALAPEMLEALELAERALENITNDNFKQQALIYIKKIVKKAGDL